MRDDPEGIADECAPPPGAAIDYVNGTGGIRCAQTTGYRMRSLRDLAHGSAEASTPATQPQ
ncbi:hypothetical protein Poly24_52180 [Rosistilla carotiformis]|uniref:Uncharacterized protein n=1 Tax=Rosistilla carotiformis TaxID=2528017 RepID=A0A518K110_9BACT|nr:hypothetical protein [Rosistilla carotiformis]QDV71482.1 hypothetical protein Poly24_52180 [Rosistilla carotiformis]